MRLWLRRITMALIGVVVILFFWPVILLVAGGVAAAVVAGFGLDFCRKRRAVQRFRRSWGRQGKDLLLVYSNSPNWQRYVEEHWLPRWGHRSVTLNWSERNEWARRGAPEVALFRAFAGCKEFNPLGIVVPPAGSRVHVVRFLRAFRDYKHGNDRRLREAEAELAHYLREAPSSTRPSRTSRAG